LRKFRFMIHLNKRLRIKSQEKIKKKRWKRRKMKKNEYSICQFLNRIEKELIEFQRQQRKIRTKKSRKKILDVQLYVFSVMLILVKHYFLIRLEVQMFKQEKLVGSHNRLELLISHMKPLRIILKNWGKLILELEK